MTNTARRAATTYRSLSHGVNVNIQGEGGKNKDTRKRVLKREERRLAVREGTRPRGLSANSDRALMSFHCFTREVLLYIV